MKGMRDLKEKCQRVASDLLANNSWTLVNATDSVFLNEVCELVLKRNATEDELENVARRATISVYCVYLYEAYHDDGSERQTQAMNETLRYLYQRLLMTADGNELLAEEAAQFAIVQAWEHWKEVRDPHSFLSYVLQIGVRQLLQIKRKDKRYDDVEDDESATPLEKLRVESFENQVELDDAIRHIYQIVHHCLERPEEIRIVIDHVLEGKSYKDLLTDWQTQASYLHLLKFRALKKLEGCEEFLRLRREWLEQA